MSTPDPLRLLVDELTAWENALEPKRDEYDTLWKAWTPTVGQADPSNPWLSKVRIPYGHHAVETIIPRIMGVDQRMSYKALDATDDNPVAAIMGALVSWQMELMGFANELRTYTRQGLVCGFTVAKSAWVQQWENRSSKRVVHEHDEALRTSFRTEHDVVERVLARNQPFFETVNVQDFVYPLNARSIRDASAVWQRRWVTLGYLRSRRKVYKNVDDVKAADYSRWQSSRQGQFDPQQLTPQQSFGSQDPESDEAVVELWERWTDERLVTIASPHSGPVLLRDEHNPFWHGMKPYVDWAPIPHPFQLHGLGVIHAIHDLTEDLNTMRRQRRDALTFTLNPVWKAVGGVNVDNIVLRPGAVIELGDMEDLQPLLNPPSSFGESMQEEERIIQDIQNLSGAFQYLSGDSSGAAAGAQTATGVATITQEGNKRIGEMIGTLNSRTMKALGRMWSSLNAQYQDEGVAVDFTKSPEAAQAWSELAQTQTPPRDLVDVDPEWLRSHGRLEPIPEIGADKQVNDVQKRSDATQVVQALAPFMAGQQPVVNVKRLVGYVLEQFGVNRTDRDQILDTSQQEQQQAAQMQAMMQAQQQQQQGPGNGSGPSGPSGPSGDNRPTGALGGTPGAAGV